MVEKKLIQLRIFYDNNLYAYAGSFHHFVVPLPPGGRLRRSAILHNLAVTRTDKHPFGTLNISTFSVSLLKADNHILYY